MYNPIVNTKALIAILVILAVGLGAYFLGKNQTNLIQIGQFSPIQSPDPIANWKTYEDSKFLNYSIMYPQDWRKQNDCSLGNDCFESADQKGFNEGIGGGYNMQQGTLIAVGYDTRRSEGDLFSYCNKKEKDPFFPCSNANFNGMSSIKEEGKYRNSEYVLTIFRFANKNTTISTLLIPNKQNQKLVDQILSTFRFE